MSYNIYAGTEAFNQTFNMSKLFYDMLPAQDEGSDGDKRGGIWRLHGKTGADCLPILKEFFENAYRAYNREFMEKYSPANGWGSIPHALIMMGRIQAQCIANPESITEVSG